MRVWVYGDIGGSGGYVRYCKGIFSSEAIPSDVEICFVCSTGFYEQIKPLNPNVQIITHPWPAGTSRLRRYLWHVVLYPYLLRGFAPDIEFYPSGQIRVFMRKATSVATCHNLLLFDPLELDRLRGTPEYGFFISYHARLAKSFRQATGVIFTSKESERVVRRELPEIMHCGIIANGLDSAFLSPRERTYELGTPIIVLYVSSIFPYKHHPEVIHAIGAVRATTGMDVRLRLVGSSTPADRERLVQVIDAEVAAEYVKIVGAVSSDALHREYDAADIFLFASSSEAFGITLLEAMGARLPIACSDRTGLPDILRDAGIYFDPEDSAAIADAVSQLLSNLERRRALGERAYRYAREFTWDRCAEQTFAFIRHVYQESLHGR